jgi:hypothetical protein
MAEGTVECANCGRANPAWAQVCRSCGAAMPAADPNALPGRNLAGVDQGSLLAIGAALGTIVVAILIGLLAAGILPPAPVAVANPTPSASAGATSPATPAPTPDPSASIGSPGPSVTPPTPPPDLPGTLSFGLGLNAETQRVTNPTDTFTPGTVFAHSVELTSPFGVTQIGEGVSKVNEDGSETLLINQADNVITGINPNALVDGFTVETNALLDALGPGTFVMRVYRGTELLAQGTFILVE